MIKKQQATIQMKTEDAWLIVPLWYKVQPVSREILQRYVRFSYIYRLYTTKHHWQENSIILQKLRDWYKVHCVVDQCVQSATTITPTTFSRGAAPNTLNTGLGLEGEMHSTIAC